MSSDRPVRPLPTRSRGAILLALTAALFSGSCAPAGPTTPVYPDANVLLITIDTLRADRLGAYGYASAETPRLDALAHGGVRFDQAISPFPMTLPSHASLMTALDPYQHGVRDNADFDISPDIVMLAESFRDAGYDTGAFVAAYVLHSRWGLSRGFDLYEDSGVHGVDDPGGDGSLEKRGDEVVAAALPWLRRQREAPFFGWIHLYDPHAPYQAPDPWGSRFADEPYDGEVAYTDTLIADILDAVDDAGLRDNTVVLVTADHGEDLLDHGEQGHGLFVYDTTQRIPLILRLPDDAAAGTVVQEQVRLVDIGPTLLDLVGVTPPVGVTGESLTGFLVGIGESRPAYAETMYPRWHLGWQELYALRKDGYKYILAPTPELYDLGTDPAETDNLADRLPDVAADMREQLEALEADVDDSSRSATDGEAARRLRALGYIGAAPSDLGDGPLPDPKDKVEVYAMLVEADSLMSEERYAEAETLLEQVVERDARLVDAHNQLGMARLYMEDYVGAEDAFLAALELRPDYEAVLASLGIAHRRLGDTELARADFEAVLALDPRNTNAMFNLGEMEMEAGDPAAALRYFDQVIALYDEPVAPRFAAAVAAYEMDDLRRAHDELEYVAATAPDFGAAHYYRALLREGQGDFDGALTMYRQALDADPTDYRALFNMALILIDQKGDHRGGVRALREAIRANPDLERAHVYLGRSLVFLADPTTYGEAETVLLRGLELGPPAGLLPMAHLTLAELYRRTGRPAEAERHQRLGERARGGGR
jgi:arylsulfatase A-like enzyme/Tfp pilus assembly protein PilF